MIKFFSDLNTRDFMGEPETSMNVIFITKEFKRKTTFNVHIYDIDAKFKRVRNQEFRETVKETDPEEIIKFLEEKLGYVETDFYKGLARCNNIPEDESAKSYKGIIKTIRTMMKD